MTKRWLSFLVVLTLLLSSFTGAAAAEVQSKAIGNPIVKYRATWSLIDAASLQTYNLMSTKIGVITVDDGAPSGLQARRIETYLASQTGLGLGKVYIETDGTVYIGFTAPEAYEGLAQQLVQVSSGAPSVISMSDGTNLNVAALVGAVLTKIEVYNPIDVLEVEAAGALMDPATATATNKKIANVELQGIATGTLTPAATTNDEARRYDGSADNEVPADVVYTYASDNPEIVSVEKLTDGTGTFASHAVGTATITVTATNKKGSKSAKINVTVKAVPATDIKIERYLGAAKDSVAYGRLLGDDLTKYGVNAGYRSDLNRYPNNPFLGGAILRGSSWSLGAVVIPSNSTDTITWSNGNSSFAKIDEDNFVRAIAQGAFKITARANSTVYKEIEGLVVVQNDEEEIAQTPYMRPMAGSFAEPTFPKIFTLTSDADIYYRVTSYTSDSARTTGISALQPITSVNYKEQAQLYDGKALDFSKSGYYYVEAIAVSRGIVKHPSATYTGKFDVQIPASGVSITSDKGTTLQGKGEINLTATVSPAGVADDSVTWVLPSPVPDGITFESDGNKLRIISDGTETSFDVTANGANGKSATVTITVKFVEPTGITASAKTLSVPVGEYRTLSATVTPANASNAVTFWIVDEGGIPYYEKDWDFVNLPFRLTNRGVNSVRVEGKYAGTATIYMRTPNGKVDTCKVTVTSSSAKIQDPTISVADGTVLNRVSDFFTINCATVKAWVYYTIYDEMGNVHDGDWIDPDDMPYRLYASDLAPNQTNTIVARAYSSRSTLQPEYASNFTVVRIVSHILPTSVTLNPNPVTIAGTQSVDVKASVGTGAANEDVTWTVGNESIAKITAVDGNTVTLTGVTNGITTVTATTVEGNVSRSAQVVVEPATAKGVVIYEEGGATVAKPIGTPYTDDPANNFIGTIGQYYQFVAGFTKVEGSEAAGNRIYPIDNTVEWSSSNENVATINQNGVVQLKGVGTTTITLEKRIKDTINGDKILKDQVVITVSNASPASLNRVSETTITATPSVGTGKDIPNEITITLTNKTLDAKIYYTLDGSDPSQSSTLYTGPFKLHNDAKLGVVAYKDGLYHSATVAAEYTFAIPATDVKLADSVIVMRKGETRNLSTIITPDYAKLIGVKWVSADSETVSVDADGKITAIKPTTETLSGVAGGAVQITVTVTTGKNTTHTRSCYVIVKDNVPDSVTISPSTLTLNVGDVRSMSAIIKPSSMSGRGVRWTSSDEYTVSVGASGDVEVVAGNSYSVTAVKPGTATITATVDGVVGTCVVTVKEDPAKAPDLPQQRVTFDPIKSFEAIENGELRKVIGKLTAGTGETWEQVAYYYNPVFTVTNYTAYAQANWPATHFEIGEDGTVTLVIPDVGTKNTYFDYTWELKLKPARGIPAGNLTVLGSGRQINGNTLTIVQKPTSIQFVPATVADIAMLDTETKVVQLGKISNYADFVKTNVPVNAQVSGLSAATATIDADGTVSVTVTKPTAGEYSVATTLTASGCANVAAPGFKVTVTEDPNKPPVKAEISATSATKYFVNPKGRWVFALADRTVQFDVKGYTVTSWKSSKPKVVAINATTGEATLKKCGTGIKISAKLSNGQTLNQVINVQKIASEIKLQYKNAKGKWVDFSTTSPMSVAVGKKLLTRAIAVTPKGAKMFKPDWVMGDTAIATRGSKGYIIGQAAGSTTVTVTLYNGVTVTGTVEVGTGKGLEDEGLDLDAPEDDYEEALVDVDETEEIDETDEVETDEVETGEVEEAVEAE